MFGGGGGGRDIETLGRLTHMLIPPIPHQLDQVAMGGGGGRGGGGGGGGDDDEFPRRDERVPQWSYQETKDFIGIRAELERDFTVARRNKTLWEVVAAKMKERGYRRNPEQCKCKWKNLVNRYKLNSD
ncbi:unnamed protein product [Ilex paraguariensis]|uniref:Myb-like domain-containing protein n=1 Tax=Ilex paraguariensis TaxID=185542 RepID=A0ABC8UET6_9AQUA